jgi:hypothetical protein
MTMPTSAILNPTARPNGLLSVARTLSGDWTRGVDVLVGSLLSPDRIGPCPVGSGDTSPPGDVARFVPVTIRQGVHCSSLSNANVEGHAANSVDVTVGNALSAELYDGSGTNNPSFDNAINLGPAQSLQDAIGMLEAEADTQLYGRLAVIHVPIGLSSQLDDIVYRDGTVWRTKAGNLVAIHGSGGLVYATGEIWAASRMIDSRSYVDRAINLTEAWADVIGIVLFDPEFNVSVTVEATSPTSP